MGSAERSDKADTNVGDRRTPLSSAADITPRFPVCEILRVSDEVPACCRLDRPLVYAIVSETAFAMACLADAYVDYSAQRDAA